MAILGEMTELWGKQIETAKTVKQKQFGDTADAIWHYMGKSYRDLAVELEGWGYRMPRDQEGPEKVRVAKVREFVSLMLPYIHEKVPHRTVRPRIPVPPDELHQAMMAAELLTAEQPIGIGPGPDDFLRSWLLEYYLNYTPGEYGLLFESRMACEEALCKGMGVVYHEFVDGPYGRMPVSSFDTIDGLFFDPDCRQRRHAGFMVRERVESVWQVAKLFNVDANKIRSSKSSHWMTNLRKASANKDDDIAHADRDVCVWYEVWSRMGVGQHLKDAGDEVKNLAAAVESLNDHVYLAIMPGMDHPLNIPPEVLESEDKEDLIRRVEWDMKTYEEPSNPWPASFLEFYPNPKNPYATSPIEAALPLQVFIDEMYAYLFARIRGTGRQIGVAAKQLAEQIKTKLAEGNDLVVCEHDGEAVELNRLFAMIEFPEINGDAWKILDAAERKWEESTGMTPLMYGNTGDTQPRSAYEVRVRQSNVAARPEDYADAVKNWMSACASKEGMLARMNVGPREVANLFGEGHAIKNESNEELVQAFGTNPNLRGEMPLTAAWAAFVNTDRPEVAAAECSYTCESGTGTRRNKQKQTADAQMLSQNLLPQFSQMLMGGIPQPFNNLMTLLSDAYDLPLSKLQVAPEMLMPMLAAQQQQAAPPQGPA
jgi:hypothetical protein